MFDCVVCMCMYISEYHCGIPDHELVASFQFLRGVSKFFTNHKTEKSDR